MRYDISRLNGFHFDNKEWNHFSFYGAQILMWNLWEDQLVLQFCIAMGISTQPLNAAKA